MQIQNIQRATLFSDFFGLELICSNDYLVYINTNNHKFVTSVANHTKLLLNNSISKAKFPLLSQLLEDQK